MSDRVCVFGLWHLGCVTAASIAAQGARVIGLDLDRDRIDGLNAGNVPIAEPGLAELIRNGVAADRLSFTDSPAEALSSASALWVTFDTPVDADDRGDVAWVRQQLEQVRPFVQPGTLVLISSQVPVGFGRSLERDWRSTDPSVQFASVPENLRLGSALEAFSAPDRIVVGLGQSVGRQRIQQLFGPLGDRIEWMSSLESAEMTKHALNGFLALSVAYTNELARICERVGADAGEVERGLRSEARIGRRAYVTAGAPIAGGTLARDVAFMNSLANDHGVQTPVLRGILDSNRLQMAWIRERVQESLTRIANPRVAVLGLTYKAGTDTLRRSSAVELAQWLLAAGVEVCAYDPAVQAQRPEISGVRLADGVSTAVQDTDVAVVATPWPAFKSIQADTLVASMRRPVVIDQAGFVPHLANDPRLEYVRVGRPRPA